MSYELTLKKAGAEILLYESFGSYQGDWWAKVKYNGIVGWVHGSYGSCSGCDSYEATFSDADKPEERDGKYYRDWRTWDEEEAISKEEYEKLMGEYDAHLADFGRPYLNDMLTQQQAEDLAAANIEWDMDAGKMLLFLKENAIK